MKAKERWDPSSGAPIGPSAWENEDIARSTWSSWEHLEKAATLKGCDRTAYTFEDHIDNEHLLLRRRRPHFVPIMVYNCTAACANLLYTNNNFHQSLGDGQSVSSRAKGNKLLTSHAPPATDPPLSSPRPLCHNLYGPISLH